MGKPKPKAAVSPDKPVVPEPSPSLAAALSEAKAAQANRPQRAAVSLSVGENGTATIGNPHADWQGWMAHCNEAFGTASEDYLRFAYALLVNAVSDRKQRPTETQANAALAMMGAIAPRDELEAAIATQIIASHAASLDFLHRSRMNAGEYIDAAATYTNMATKTSRTMAAHIEALAKLRTGGKQTVEVIYVDARNSQNVIGGEIRTGGGGTGGERLRQSHTPLASAALAPGLAVRSEDAEGHALPGTCGTAQASLSNARRESWGADRGAERSLQARLEDEGAGGGAPDGAGAGEERQGEPQ